VTAIHGHSQNFVQTKGWDKQAHNRPHPKLDCASAHLALSCVVKSYQIITHINHHDELDNWNPTMCIQADPGTPCARIAMFVVLIFAAVILERKDEVERWS
jgi:hypothetical protein